MLKAWDSRCRFCHSELDLNIDHIRPVALGGTNDPSNLMLLCRCCNSKKRHLPLVQWAEDALREEAARRNVNLTVSPTARCLLLRRNHAGQIVPYHKDAPKKMDFVRLLTSYKGDRLSVHEAVELTGLSDLLKQIGRYLKDPSVKLAMDQHGWRYVRGKPSVFLRKRGEHYGFMPVTEAA